MADQVIKIPVFSVLKNGINLKNIILNNPQWESDPPSDLCSHDQQDDPILIGRHPDCHVVLDHPSISRFHLEIRAKPSLQMLSVIDRSSVHGTWVSGNKIQPNVPVDLMEGDALMLGASTRVYKLHWVPLGGAFEMEDPFPALAEENEESHQLENPHEDWAKQTPSAPPLPEPFPSPLENYIRSPSKREFEKNISSFSSFAQISESVGSSLPMEGDNRTPENNADANEVKSTEYMNPLTSGRKKYSSSILSRRSKSKSVSFLRIQTGHSKDKMRKVSEAGATLEECKGEKAFCKTLFSDAKDEKEDDNDDDDEETFVSDKENITPLSSIGRKSKARVLGLSAKSLNDNFDEEYASSEETLTHKYLYSQKSRKSFKELQISSLDAFTALRGKGEGFYLDQENRTLDVSRELKTSKLLQRDQMQISGGEEKEAFFSKKENLTPTVWGSQKSNKNLCRVFLNIDGDEEFLSDKENLTPDALGVKKSKRVLSESQARIERKIMEKRKERIPFQSLLENSPSDNGSPLSNAQRSVEKVRIPFQSLLENSPSKNGSPLNHHTQKTAEKEKNPFQSLQSSSLRNSSPVNNTQRVADTGNKCSTLIQSQLTGNHALSNSYSQSVGQVLNNAGGEKKRKWNMVIDTGCFLNEESRRSLQLLEGLKGTQLIIPRIVIRELDCLKRRESLFRKETKAASSALQWIEECMVKFSWWIHVQSSLETMPVAATPPATPRSELTDGSSNSMVAFSTCASLMEIVSPTAEDHILDCALLFARIKGDDGQLVLLTNSTTLKIKSMAEGLVCETPYEFRESLVNPYSKRFLWSSNSPRGATWSCLDEAGLIENYYHHQFPAARKTAKVNESVKGLKLILLRNSHYAKTSSVN